MQYVKVDAIRARVRARQVFSWQEFLVLMECKERSKVAQIADRLGMPKPSVTRAIDNLAAPAQPKPFLRRRPDTEDRRSPWIEITPDGARFLAGFVVDMP